MASFIDQLVVNTKSLEQRFMGAEKMEIIERVDGVVPFPVNIGSHDIKTNGVTMHTRVGGHGPAVVMLHGFGTTGDMWAPMAKALVSNHTVIVPDLRGLGLSSKPGAGYDKKTQSRDILGILDVLGVEKADFVTHDIGNMVGYAFAATQPDRVGRFVPIDAPIPGVGPWDQITQDPTMWQFGFGGPDMERLVEGRERIYLDRFWNEFALHPERFDEEKRKHYAKLYSMPGAMRASFAQFRTFPQDALDSKTYTAKGKLMIPILAVGGESTFGSKMAQVMRVAAENVEEAIVPDSGHWIMEENPSATTKLVVDFLDA
jgi:pimeloyl-ACP methyl ester carboxylesterase